MATGVYAPDTSQGGGYGPYDATIQPRRDLSRLRTALVNTPTPAAAWPGSELFFAENITLDDDSVGKGAYGVGVWPEHRAKFRVRHLP